MKKAILIGCLIIAVASLVYFTKSPSKEATSQVTGTGTQLQNAESNPDSQVTQTNLEEIKPIPALDNSSPEPKGTVSAPEKNQEWYKNFEASLSENATGQGLTQEVADCLLSAARQNINQENPLDFDALSDACAAKHHLSEVQRDALRKSFRKSISSSHALIDMDKWKACMLTTYKAGSCIPDLIRENVEAFYTQKSGNAPMKKEAFEQERQTEIEKILDIALKECPKSLDRLNGVYAIECT
ncbi:MAG TPA: hypothetical protein VE954_24745 [Oligoflexus sp.]|uniref:hypothetical protein n=1 Tax=Oligoflexus sp. TaxID=1971216 RepID=UPI002D307FBA|nr:hypothetical protein [Oligoflexus sp.]HYX36326.1 hypothetical protein [Oligoflexus sp.]